MTKRGLVVSTGEGNLSTETVMSGGEPVNVTVYTDPRTGNKMAPGPGWNYNPGQAAWHPDLDRYDYSIAMQYVKGGLTGPDFSAFYRGIIGGNFPVAVLDEQYKQMISSKSQTVYLSSDTLAKNKIKHPDLALPEYQMLPDIISQAQLVIEEQGRYLLFLRREGKLYYAVVKTTSNREELYLTSYRRTGEKDLRDALRKGTVIKNEL